MNQPWRGAFVIAAGLAAPIPARGETTDSPASVETGTSCDERLREIPPDWEEIHADGSRHGRRSNGRSGCV